MDRKFFRAFLIGAIFLGIGAGAAFAQGRNAICPVMPGTAVKDKFFVDYQGKRVYLCCRACVKAFKKNPKKYIKRLS